MTRRDVLAATAALLLAGCDESERPAEAVRPSSLADLHLETLDGRRETLGHLVGRVVLLNVWATWCAPCRAELPALQRLAQALPASDYAVVTMSVDDNPVFVREYLRDAGIALPCYLDRGGRVSRDVMAIGALPHSIAYDTTGVARRGISGVRPWDTAEMRIWLETVGTAGRSAWHGIGNGVGKSWPGDTQVTVALSQQRILPMEGNFT